MLTRETALFCLMCLIWGVTWVAMKAGLAVVPPLFFAGTRFVVAGAVIAALQWLRGGAVVPVRAAWFRMVAVSILLVSLTYGLLFWGMQFVNSGTAAMLEMSFTPVALLGFALLFRHEAFSLSRALAITLGIGGLALLFGPKMTGVGEPMEAVGALATVAAALVYGLGSVLARPLLKTMGPQAVAASTMLLGGLILLGASWLLEPGAGTAARLDWGIAAWSGWLFLVVFGSLGGFTIYLHLLTRWGASIAGSYAFVSPVIAVLAGMIVYGERISRQDGVGMAVMLVAAWLALRGAPGPQASTTFAAKPARSRSSKAAFERSSPPDPA